MRPGCAFMSDLKNIHLIHKMCLLSKMYLHKSHCHKVHKGNMVMENMKMMRSSAKAKTV